MLHHQKLIGWDRFKKGNGTKVTHFLFSFLKVVHFCKPSKTIFLGPSQAKSTPSFPKILKNSTYGFFWIFSVHLIGRY